MRRQTSAVRRTAALLLALLLPLQNAWAVRIAAPVIKAVPGSAAGAAGLSPLVGVAAAPGLLRAPSLGDSLPRLGSAPKLMLPNAAVAETQGRSVSLKKGLVARSLTTAAAALAGSARAAAKLPGLAALGSNLEAPDAKTSSANQAAVAEHYFRRKAGLAHEMSYDAVDALQAAYEENDTKASTLKRFFPHAAAGRRKRPAIEITKSPIYPARRVRFRGKTFPSAAFRPDRAIEPHLIEAIDASQNTIKIALYEFKNRAILKALRRAKKRGVEVEMIIDFYHAYPTKREGNDFQPHRSLEIQSLIDEGFDIQVLRGGWRYGIMHNKVAVFDGKLGHFGSYNWSYTSERNHYENVLFTTEKERVKGLEGLLKYLNGISVPFKDAQTRLWPEELPPPPKKAPTVFLNRRPFPAWIYTPDAAAEDQIVSAIEAAKTSVDLSMFTFTSQRIAEAILAAEKRGLKVRVLFDKSQAGQSFMEPYVQWLAFHGVKVKTLAGPNPDGPQWAEKNHNKFMILDGKFVLTGSLNYTTSGFRTNFENLHFLNHRGDAKAYNAYFADLFGDFQAERVVPSPQEPALPDPEQILKDLRGPPAPLPPPPTWAKMPKSRSVRLGGETFPANAVRPQDPVEDLIVKAIDSSNKEIRIALYEFNLEKIMEAMRRAKKRGVKVRIVIDYNRIFPKGDNYRGEERRRNPITQALIDEGFDLWVLRGRRASGIMHNKFAVFDGKMVEYGSYNWSYTAEYHHFESVKFDSEKARVAAYLRYWEWMRSYSVRVEEAPTHKWAKEGPNEGYVETATPLEFNGERFPLAVFSPLGQVEDTVVRAIRAAKASIDITMFSFYSARIAEELLLARERDPKLKIRIVLDRMQSKLMKLDDWFAYHDFDVKLTAGPDPYADVYLQKNHNKYMMIDGKLLLFGSYNYTGNAEQNSYENVGLHDDPLDLAFYRAYFEMLYQSGWRPLKPKTPPDGTPSAAEFFSPERYAALEAVETGI